MRFLLTLLLIPILGISQDNYPLQSEVDIHKYSNYIELNDSNDRIIGKSVVEFELKSFVDSIHLDLVGEKNGKGMIVQGVFYIEQPLNFNHVNNRLSIELNNTIKPSTSNQIQILYEGIPADGLIISKNKHGDRTFFGDNWPNRAHNWFPCIDHPSEKAKVEFQVLAPDHYQVISNGSLRKTEKIEGGYMSTTYTSNYVLPTKVMVIGVAKFAVKACEDNSETRQSAYVYPQELKAGFSDYCSTTEILAWFENKIGPYPYEKLAHVQSKTRYGGMENAGCIFYHENSIDGNRGSEYLFAHEIAHQWFGNSASEKDWYHVWLSEGFATYLTEVYKQETAGDTAFYNGMNQAKKRVIRYQKRVPAGKIIDTSITNLNRLLSPMTYQKAAWVLHSLRIMLGDEVFWKGIRSYYSKYEYGNALSVDFQTEMEEVSGKDLTLFFSSWLYQPGLVKLKIDVEIKQRTATVTLSQPKDNWFVIPVQFNWYSHTLKIMEQPEVTYTFINIPSYITESIIKESILGQQSFLMW